jgi:cytoplasmic iron level regulating protein YaaA (DUF328/UPF0246 family)
MKPAAFTFNGDAYQHLDINSLEVEQLAYLNQHLLIFSGLYGFLNAFDYIKPYRIDMGTDIALAYKGTFFKNLYQIWQPILVNAWFEMHISPLLDPINNINNIKEMEEMKDCKDIYVINLASKEYAKAFELKYLNPKNQALLSQHHLKIKIVDIDFKQRKKDGGFASIGIKNKQARGAFLRYMAQNQVFNLEKCCEFAEDDYIFSPRQSTFINHKTDKIHLTFVQG